MSLVVMLLLGNTRTALLIAHMLILLGVSASHDPRGVEIRAPNDDNVCRQSYEQGPEVNMLHGNATNESSSLDLHGHPHQDFMEHSALFIFTFVSLSVALFARTFDRQLKMDGKWPLSLIAFGFLLPQVHQFLVWTKPAVMLGYFNKYTWMAWKTDQILLALQPILIFDTCFNIEWYHLKKRFFEVVLIGLLCSITSIVLLATWVFVFSSLITGNQWPFVISLLFSVIVSPSDIHLTEQMIADTNMHVRLRLLMKGHAVVENYVSLFLSTLIPVALLRGSVDCVGLPGVGALLGRHLLNIPIIFLVTLPTTYLLTLILNRIRNPVFGVSLVVFACFTSYGAAYYWGHNALGFLATTACGTLLNGLKPSIHAETVENVTGILLLLKFWSLSICWIVVGVIVANLLNTLDRDVGTGEFYQTIWLTIISYLGAVLLKYLPLAVYSRITQRLSRSIPGVTLPASFPLAIAYFSPRGVLCLLLAKKFSESTSTRLSDQATLIAALVCLIFLVLHWKFAAIFIDKTQLNQVSLLRRQRTDHLVRCLNEQASRPLPKLYGGVSMEAVRMTSTLFTAEEEEEMEEERTDTSEIDDDADKMSARASSKVSDAKKSVRSRSATSTRRASKVVVEETMGMTDRIIVMDAMLAYVLGLGKKHMMSSAAVRFLSLAISDAVHYNRPLDVDDLVQRAQPYQCVQRLDWSLRRILDKLDRFMASRGAWLRRLFVGDVPLSPAAAMWQLAWHLIVFAHAALALLLAADVYSLRAFRVRLFLVLIGDLCCSLEIVFRFLVYRKDWRAYLVQRVALRMYDLTRLLIYLASGCCIPFYMWYCVCDCDVMWEHLELTLDCADAVKRQHFSPVCQGTFQTGLCVMSTLFFLPIWLFLLFPRVLSGYLHIWVLDADQLASEVVLSIQWIADHVSGKLVKGSEIALQEYNRRLLETENLNMKRRSERHMIDLLNKHKMQTRRMLFLKTRQLARIILGELDEELENVWNAGGLGEHDYEHMKETMEAMLDATKNQFAVPKARNLFSAERLKRVPWIAQSNKQRALIKFLEKHFVEMMFEPSSYLMKQGDSVDGIHYVVSGVCRFAVRQEDGKLKPLHLIYAGRFTGESALFLSAASNLSRLQAELPRRSGSVYAETSVVTRFLPIARVLQLFHLDASVVRTFEDYDSLYTCERHLRQLVPFNAWALWTLHNFIRTKWVVCSAPQTLNALQSGERAVLVKGTFELNGKRVAVDRGQLCDGPIERLTALASPAQRCFFLGLYRHQLTGEPDARLGLEQNLSVSAR